MIGGVLSRFLMKISVELPNNMLNTLTPSPDPSRTFKYPGRDLMIVGVFTMFLMLHLTNISVRKITMEDKTYMPIHKIYFLC